MLEEDHRIGIAHRRRHQPDYVAWVRRRNYLEAWDHHAPVFHALAVLRAETRARAVARADDQRTFDLAVRHVAALRKLIGDVIETDREEVREHDLGNRLEAGHCRTHGGTENGLLGNWSVAHAQRPKLFVKTDRCLEHTTGLGNILAEKYDVGIAGHLLRDAANDCVAVGQFRHAQPPSA